MENKYNNRNCMEIEIREITISKNMREDINKIANAYQKDNNLSINKIDLIYYDGWVCIELYNNGNAIDLIRIAEFQKD